MQDSYDSLNSPIRTMETLTDPEIKRNFRAHLPGSVLIVIVHLLDGGGVDVMIIYDPRACSVQCAVCIA